ncbi:uncharacterized protein LOC124483350 isoform X4 [Hypomesus transpacificus]|uniref:uncharacterized protein LOC124483350 isoform X4 n=1 Tax=Hypomesus transpacificus TaxID=137520 RepID=UPI001F07C0C2|nr:uncharacterized protein LOC124483350 isoform X4 [Hypomesus transpacificus]
MCLYRGTGSRYFLYKYMLQGILMKSYFCALTDGYNADCSPQSSTSALHTRGPVENDWHFNFSIPWNKMPTELMRKLKNKEQPKKNERLQMIKLLRKDITSGEEVTDLEREWPYLFEPCGMRSHFKELTGVYVTEEAIESKSERVVLFLKSFEKRNKTEDILADVEVDKQKHLKANLPASLLLLLRHFNEDADQMFHKMDEVCLAFEVDCAKLPKTPCIIVCGKSPVTAETFMVSADQCIVNGSVTNFGDALFLMFALYYCLNISYPATLGTTLEFLQRCIFRINPDKGTKVEKGSKKAVNAKVLSLIQKISDYEWRE